ncbi:uncharacterized protein DEA37_0011739, partial [Paragonimus westermani]
MLLQHLERSLRQNSPICTVSLLLDCLRRTVRLCTQTVDCWISSESLNRTQLIILALLCDCFTILVNQLYHFYQQGHYVSNLEWSTLCASTFNHFVSQTIPRLIKQPWFVNSDSIAPLWVPLLRGLLRLVAIQVFNDSTEHDSNLVNGCCVALRAISPNSHGTQLYRFLLHELVDSSFVSFPANSSRCKILSRFFISGLQELPCDLINYLIDLFYCHFSIESSANILGSYNNNEFIFCLWSILLRTPKEVNPRLIRFFFVLLNNLPFAQLDFCLSVMLSGLAEQLLMESSTISLLTFLSSLLDCAFGLFTRHARHLFLASLLRTIFLPLCLHLPMDRWHTEFGLIFFDQCWVQSLGAYDAYYRETVKLAMACLDCVDTDDHTVNLAASIRQWPTLRATVIKSLMHLLRVPVGSAVVRMGQGMMIQLWQRLIDCLLRLLLWQLQSDEHSDKYTCILLNLFINPLWSTIQVHKSDADRLLFDYLLPCLINYRTHPDTTSISVAVPSLLFFVTRLILRLTPDCVAIQQPRVPVCHGQTRWVGCITMLASKLADTSMSRQFELHSLLNESLDMLTHHTPCSMIMTMLLSHVLHIRLFGSSYLLLWSLTSCIAVGVAITQLMRSICLRNRPEAVSGGQLAVQLSPDQLEQVLRTIQRLLRQKDDVLRCRCDQTDRSKTLLSFPVLDKTSFPSSLKSGDLIHVVSLESVSRLTEACVRTTENPFYAHLRSDWSLQVILASCGGHSQSVRLDLRANADLSYDVSDEEVQQPAPPYPSSIILFHLGHHTNEFNQIPVLELGNILLFA